MDVRQLHTTNSLRMFIQTQDTPNPNSMKFLPGIEVSILNKKNGFGNLTTIILIKLFFNLDERFWVQALWISPLFLKLSVHH